MSGCVYVLFTYCSVITNLFLFHFNFNQEFVKNDNMSRLSESDGPRNAINWIIINGIKC